MSKTGVTMAAPNQRFINSPFNGCKEHTRELLEEIRNVVSNECGQFGIGYLLKNSLGKLRLQVFPPTVPPTPEEWLQNRWY